MLEKGSKCSRCGTAQWEWDPAQGGSKFAYEAVAVYCKGCDVTDAGNSNTDRQPGVTVELHPTGTRASAQRAVAAQQRQQARRTKKQR